MKAKLIPLGLIVLYIGIYFVFLLPADYLFFTLLPMNKFFGVASTIVANVIFEIVLVALYSFLVYKIKKAPPLKVWNRSGVSVPGCIAALLVGISSGLFTVCLFKLPFTLDHFPACNQLLLTFFGQGTVITFALFCITSSVFKEVMFRGLIMNELRSVVPVAAAIILQAVLYGAVNFYSQGIVAVAFAAVGALVFALIYFWSGNIFIPMIAQFGDISTIILLTMLKDGVINRTTSVYAFAPSIVGLFAFGFYFFRLYRKSGRAANQAPATEKKEPAAVRN